MGLKREERDLLRQFIIENVEKHSHDIVAQTMSTVGISRQAVHNHINKLIEEEIILKEGTTRNARYKLLDTMYDFDIAITSDLQEDVVWSDKIAPILTDIKKNVYDICYYGFTEMLNNVIDHSETEKATIQLKINALKISFLILDEGVGIFKKIQKAFNLDDPRHAILELAKGKLTTDPERHTGEGIYYTSRMFDDFDLLSDKIYFHGQKNNDWLLEKEKITKGTAVFMDIKRKSLTTIKQVFDVYSPEKEDFGFSKTKVPVKMLRHEGEELVSRSQAKRLIMGFNRFKEVILDFEGIKIIGQPFADEVFRVFKRQNPEVHLTWINTNEDIKKMIKHVMSNE